MTSKDIKRTQEKCLQRLRAIIRIFVDIYRPAWDPNNGKKLSKCGDLAYLFYDYMSGNYKFFIFGNKF